MNGLRAAMVDYFHRRPSTIATHCPLCRQSLVPAPRRQCDSWAEIGAEDRLACGSIVPRDAIASHHLPSALASFADSRGWKKQARVSWRQAENPRPGMPLTRSCFEPVDAPATLAATTLDRLPLTGRGQVQPRREALCLSAASQPEAQVRELPLHPEIPVCALAVDREVEEFRSRRLAS